MRNREHGFTLVELIVAMAVFGIALSLAIPSFSAFMANQRAKTAAYGLVNALGYTRSEAIKRNSTVQLQQKDGSWSNGWSIVVPGGTPITVRTYDVGEGISVTASGGATSVSYAGSGRSAAGTNVTFTICDTSSRTEVRKRVVTLDLAGLPNLKFDGNCGS